MLSSWCANAQVQSTAYSVMLKTLLAHSVTEVSVQEAEPMKNVLFLDARELSEFRVSHIKDAIHIGYTSANWDVLNSLEKDTRIIVYCSVGYRSEKIAEQLRDKGFTNVQNLYGGIFEWVNQDRVVVDANQKVTTNVHAYNKTWGIWLNKGTKVYE